MSFIVGCAVTNFALAAGNLGDENNGPLNNEWNRQRKRGSTVDHQCGCLVLKPARRLKMTGNLRQSTSCRYALLAEFPNCWKPAELNRPAPVTGF
jgi:hypothetical protein